MTEIMPGIKAVYQMQSEFSPYLGINFLPHFDKGAGEPAGIILGTTEGFIRRNYTFDNPNDLIELRKLIWHYLMKEQKGIKPVERNGQSYNLRQMSPNKIIQGWDNMVTNTRRQGCCEQIVPSLQDRKIDTIMANKVRDPRYTPTLPGKIDRQKCIKIYGQNCGDNYPPNTMLYDKCMREVMWLCENGYPVNKRVNTMNKLVKNTQGNLLKKLEKNDYVVNKREFSDLGFAGMVDNTMLNEGFDGTCLVSNDNPYLSIFSVFVFVVILVAFIK